MQPVTPPPVKNPLDLILAKLHVATNGFFLQLPNIIGGIVLLLIAYFLGTLIARGVRKGFHNRGLVDLGGVLASQTFGGIMVAAVLIASVIVFPSVKPATIISSLGIGSVAIGFAFKDILQNLLAGILLLVNRRYRRGDQIIVKDFEGTVEHIESRATLIKTYDGRRVIPNSDVYTSPVVVNTAFPTRRDQLDIGIGYGDRPDRAMTVFAEAIAKVEGIETDPSPEALPWGLGRQLGDTARAMVVLVEAHRHRPSARPRYPRHLAGGNGQRHRSTVPDPADSLSRPDRVEGWGSYPTARGMAGRRPPAAAAASSFGKGSAG